MKPVMHDPPLCSLHELQDGTYSIEDVADFHEAMEIEEELTRRQIAHDEAKMRNARGR